MVANSHHQGETTISILTEVQAVLNDYYDVQLTPNQVFDVFAKVPRWTKEIKEWGPHDTESRRYIINSLCIYMGMNKMWPMFMDLPSYEKEFHEEFQRKLGEFGFK